MRSVAGNIGWQRIMLHATRMLLPVLIILCLIGDFYIARSWVPNSDTIQNYGQLQSVLHGNVVLHHWVLSEDNFYFTDLLFFILLSFVFGAGLNLVYIVPFVVFCLFLLACCLIVARAAKNEVERYFGLFLVVFLLGMPYAPWLDILLRSAIHMGTVTLCLYAILSAQPILSGGSVKRSVFVTFSVLVAAIAFSDPLAEIFFVAPLLVLVILRAWLFQVFRRAEWALFGCTIGAAGIGAAVEHVLNHNGGFSTGQAFPMSFVTPMPALATNIHAILRAVQILFTARAAVLDHGLLDMTVAAIRLVAAGIAVILACWVIWRMPRDSQAGLSQFFVLACVILAMADAVSALFNAAIGDGPGFPNSAIRYVMPVYVFLSLAATLEAQRLFSKIRHPILARTVSGIVILAALPFFAMGAQASIKAAHAPPGIVNAPQADLTAWLTAHRFHYGVGDYWTSQMIFNLSQARIETSPVVADGNHLILFAWNCDISSWSRMRPPQFVVILPGNVFGVTIQTVEATYGAPQRTYQVGTYMVVQYVAP